MRCREGLALCKAIDEIRSDQAQWDILHLQQLTGGRPRAQLDMMRAKLADHDEGCWVCRGVRADADPGDEN